MILLDTNAIVAYFENDRFVKRQIDRSQIIYFSVVVLGELLYGYKKGARQVENIKRLNHFLVDSRLVILQVSTKTPSFYSDIKLEIMKVGNPIPDNDIWIAAQAKETEARLITYDKHFLKIPGLKVWSKLK